MDNENIADGTPGHIETTAGQEAAPVTTAENRVKKTAKGVAVGRSDLHRLNPSDITIRDGLNSRLVDFDPKNDEDMALAVSIAENGIKEPLAVFNDNGEIVLSNGHRRMGALAYAIRELGVDPATTVSVMVEPQASSEADRIFSQITRNSGKPFTALEQAIVFEKLAKLEWPTTEIAKKAGVSEQRVRDLLDLQKKASVKVKRMVQSGEISATLAITTLKKTKGDSKKTAEVLTDAVKKAKESGKKKATAKDVAKAAPAEATAPAAPSLKGRLRSIFSELTITETDGGETFNVAMTADEYAEVRGLIGF